MNIKEKQPDSKMIFSPKDGSIDLMFLKHYSCCSDKKYIEQLNDTIDYQFFCDIHLSFTCLTNFKIVSQIRCELIANLNINILEKDLFAHRKLYIDSKNQITVDVICYERELHYPIPQKLL